MRSLIHSSGAALLALLALSAGAAGTQSGGAFSSQAAGQTPSSAAATAQDNMPGDGVRRITPAEVREALARGEAVIVDVRGPNAYEDGHIRGALSIPYAEVLSRTSELPRDKMIITYCS